MELPERRSTPKNGSPIEIEEGQGFAIAAVILTGEWDMKVSFLYDAAKTWPKAGDWCSASMPQVGLTTATPQTPNATWDVFVGADPEITKGRKKEAMISYLLCRRPAIARPTGS